MKSFKKNLLNKKIKAKNKQELLVTLEIINTKLEKFKIFI